MSQICPVWGLAMQNLRDRRNSLPRPYSLCSLPHQYIKSNCHTLCQETAETTRITHTNLLDLSNHTWSLVVSMKKVIFAATAALHSAQTHPVCDVQHVPPSLRVLFTFDPPVAIENVALTSRGHLLLTTLYDGGRLYSLDPLLPQPDAQVIATLPGCDGLTGIRETAHDVFAVTGGPLGATGFVGLRTFSVTLSGTQTATVTETASVPDTAMLNGIAKLPRDPAVILAADSFRGEIVRINTVSGKVDVAIKDALFRPTTAVSLGINGLDVLGDHLYFTNSGQGIFARIKINPDGSKVNGSEAEILARIPGTPSRQNFYDDFAVWETREGKLEAFVATQANSVYHILDGKQSLFLGGGNSTWLKVPTRSLYSKNGKKLYVVTGGGQVVEADL